MSYALVMENNPSLDLLYKSFNLGMKNDLKQPKVNGCAQILLDCKNAWNSKVFVENWKISLELYNCMVHKEVCFLSKSQCF